jgi:hypothetical protein
VERTVGGIFGAQAERWRAGAERVRGPSWWFPRSARRRRWPSDPGSATPSRGADGTPAAATANDRDDDASVRGYLRQLCWTAPGLLVTFLGLWASGVARGMSLPAALFSWPSSRSPWAARLAPLWRPKGGPRWWRALGVAVLWWLAAAALLGDGYALVVAVLTSGRR